jgi:chloramphenicol 3-O-phosphotransferase
MKFSDTINDNIVINCVTLQDAQILLIIAHKKGLKWESGDSYNNKNLYHIYKEETCYNLSSGLYSSRHFYINNGMTVINFDDIEFTDEELSSCIKHDGVSK